jgi:hypothetical protein
MLSIIVIALLIVSYVLTIGLSLTALIQTPSFESKSVYSFDLIYAKDGMVTLMEAKPSVVDLQFEVELSTSYQFAA